MRVLLTRPDGQAEALGRALAARGCVVEHRPLLAIEALDPLPGAERQRILDLDLYQHLIFVSANAARIGLACIDDYWPQRPMGQQYWAVGASTAAVLASAGIEASYPFKDMSSEGLLALPGLQGVAGQRVLIVRGEGGRQLIAETLAERGAEVASLSCYRRQAVAYDGALLRVELAKNPPQLALVSSGEGLALLSRLLQPMEHTNLARITLLVPSPRVAQQAQTLGWERVLQSDNASDGAVLDAVDAWRDANLGREGFD